MSIKTFEQYDKVNENRSFNEFFTAGDTLILEHPKTGSLKAHVNKIKYSPLGDGFYTLLSIENEDGEIHDTEYSLQQLKRDIFPHVVSVK